MGSGAFCEAALFWIFLLHVDHSTSDMRNEVTFHPFGDFNSLNE
jgi:hypothetical protein